MSNNNDLFGGFDAISSLSDMFVKGTGDGLASNKPPLKVEEKELEEEEEIKSTTEVDDPDIETLRKSRGIKSSTKTTKVEPEEDESDEEEEEEGDETPTNDEETEDVSEYEEAASKYFATDLADKLNITLPEKYEAKKMEDVIDLMLNIIKDNSTPEFANDDVAALNKFVEEGGDLREFYKELYADSLNVDKVDIENERDQKSVIKEHLRNKGFKDEKITRAIERYEEAGMLKEEAEDALEALKDYNTKTAKKLLADQEKFYQDQQKAKQAFIDTVYNTVEKSNSILNVPLSKDEKKEMLDYIFKVDKNGVTQMQKELQDPEAQVNDLLERAFIRKFSNKLFTNTKKQGANDALLEVKNKLKAGKDKRSAGGNTSFGKASSQSLSSLSSFFK